MAHADAKIMLHFRLSISESTSRATVDKELMLSCREELILCTDKGLAVTVRKITYQFAVVATQADSCKLTQPKEAAIWTWKVASLIAQAAIAQLWL